MKDLERAIALHDSAVAVAGRDIWIGAEPTFTLRTSEQPQWLSQALGGDKEAYARRMARALAQRHPRAVLLRSIGRQYAGEERARWSYGLYERRDAAEIWNGPPDPLMIDRPGCRKNELDRLVAALARGFLHAGWSSRRLRLRGDGEQDEIRLLMHFDGSGDAMIEDDDARLARDTLDAGEIPREGLSDSLADEGHYLFVCRRLVLDDGDSLAVELPSFSSVDDFLRCLAILGEAADESATGHLLLQGYPPPVDERVAWTTITPDPAVIEVNQAPQPDIAGLHAANSELFEVAESLGLSPYRLQYNGTISDSGGGGQFTLGGPSASRSPFFVQPRLLPRLVRYVNQHPSLSYWFATNYVGATSQSPRADENTLDSFSELALALDRLEARESISPEFLFQSLSPFLADTSGNSHRSELNIEKLWNRWLPQRGCLGLLEFRAFRMPFSPRRAVAIATLLRAISAMLCDADPVTGLHAWRDELHDRFALPLFLRRDLRAVLRDLERTGFGVGDDLAAELLSAADRPLWSVEFGGCRIEIEPAIEFWPLVGDTASQEAGGSRLVDASTLRLQLSLHGVDKDAGLDQWVLSTQGYRIPLRDESEDGRALRLIGLRYRDFVPWRGLHPSITPTSPLTLYLSREDRDEALQLSLHNWRADGIPYDGLPESLEDARQRCQQRLVVTHRRRKDLPGLKAAPLPAVTPFLFDLRWLD